MESPQFSGELGKSKRFWLFVIPVVLALAVALAVVFNAGRALQRATQSVEGDGQLGFKVGRIDPSFSLAHGFGSEPVAPAASYAAGTFFGGELYLGGPSGLTILRSDGTSRLNLRTGFELPVSAIAGIAVGRMRGASEPQILLATQGAGLLLLEPRSRANPTIFQLLPADPNARDLTALLPLPDGDLLLGTRHRGLLIYDGATLKPFPFKLLGINPEALQVTALAAVDSASFLIGTRDSGVFYAHAGTVDHADLSSGMPDNEVESVAVSSATGRGYVGTPTGTAEFSLDGSSFRPVRVLGKGLFGRALALEQGRLSIGTLDQGVQQIPLEASTDHRRSSVATVRLTSPLQRVDAFLSSPNALYALADGSLLRRSGADWTPALPPSPATLTDSNVSALAFADDGTLYVGFFDRGIDLLSPEGRLSHIEDDHLFCINRLALDPERHTMAAATANGLVLFDAQHRPRQTLTRRDGLISDHITDIAFRRTGATIATPAGITFLGPSAPESLYAFEGLANNHVYALATYSPSASSSDAASEQTFAGTLGGISILRAHSIQRNLTTSNSSLKHNWITALLPMPANTMLVGTYGAGLETFDAQGRFTPVELPAGTPRNLVINPNALYASSSHVYAGTLGHGMLVYSTATGRWSQITNGLPSLNVTAFASRAGRIYVGTDNGLVRIPEVNLP